VAVRLDPCDDPVMPGQHEVDLRMLVEEQAALNRVAVTVATETAAERVFDVVTEEVARLLGADAANLVRFGPTRGEGVIVGKWSEPGVPIPGAGTIVEIAGGALAEVARTGAPARMATEDPGVPKALHERLIALGVTSVVAAPIGVSGASGVPSSSRSPAIWSLRRTPRSGSGSLPDSSP
jgi:GAF domain-containing protein